MKTKFYSLTVLAHWLDRWQPSETFVLGATSLLVGVTAGAGVWLFKQLIDLAHLIVFEGITTTLSPLGWWVTVFSPILGGLIVGWLLYLFVGAERHHGVAGIIEAVALAGGRLRYWRIPAKTVAAALSIGSGASVGPEDPSVQIGANLGSMFGQWFRLSDERVRALVAAGAAAGVSAAFNAPIAAVFFALEIILGEISGYALGVVVLAAVVSAVFTQAISGPQPAFHVPAYAFHSAWELPLYAGLGLLAGPIAALYIRLLYLMQDIFHGWSLPNWLKPAAAGVMVGLVGLTLPQVLGIGYETIEHILAGSTLALGLLLALLFVKLILTPVSIGGGFPGGVFAPSLFLGATLGAAYGDICERIFPAMGITPPAFAMVGMAAMLAGTVHAPLTAILLLFEMTNDYHIILPLMFAVVMSLLFSQRLQRDSVYTLGLARKGVRIERGRDVEVLDALRVDEVMQANFTTLLETDTLQTATEILLKLRSHGLPVTNNQGDLVGIVSVQDIDRVHTDEGQHLTIGQICTRQLLVAYPNETLGTALRRMSVRDVGRLPVVARDNPRRLLGVLRRTDIIRAYDLALTRRATLRHQAQQVRLGLVSGMSVAEVTIETGASCLDHSVSQIPWPRDCVITSIRRGRQLLIPHGDTVLQAGDVLVLITQGDALPLVQSICQNSEKKAPSSTNNETESEP